MLAGLILHASGQPEKLAKNWVSHATTDAHQLCTDAEGINNVIEVDSEPDASVERMEIPQAVINPVATATRSCEVGFVPVRFPATPDLTIWGLIDTGAQVSVITAGLANFLGLINEDLSNVTATPFTVKGYNDVKSYMPAITVNLRMGREGGTEREFHA